MLASPLATAGEAAAGDGALALYEGRLIDLSDGWDGATACAVLSELDVRCYDSEAEMRDELTALARRDLGDDMLLSSSCGGSSSFTTLYDDVNFGGASLSFASTSGWVNLSSYGFDNRMESWVNDRDCNATVADGTLGGGAQLTLAANGSSSNVGTDWKNKASSIRVPA
jgi:hypothetical protein